MDAKATLRRRLIDRRRALPEAERTAAADALAAYVLALPEIARARRVSAYLSLPSEPGTAGLVAGLIERGIEVMAPVVIDDRLDWVLLDAGTEARLGSHHVPEPVGSPLGPAAVETADLLLVPGLAVDPQGHRLGRGGGHYDRVLARDVGPACILLYAAEVLDEVPVEAHDRPVDMVATELGVSHLGTP